MMEMHGRAGVADNLCCDDQRLSQRENMQRRDITAEYAQRLVLCCCTPCFLL